MTRWPLLCLVLVAPLAWAGGCTRDGDDDSAIGASRVVVRRGAEFRVEVDRVSMDSADRLRVTITAVSPTGGHVELPLIGETLGEFTVVEATPQRITAEGAGRVKREREMILEPFLPGEYRIPSLSFAMMPEGGEASIVETPEIVINVTSSLGVDPPEAGLAPWLDIVEPTADQSPNAWAIGTAGVAVITAVVGAVLWRKRHRRARQPEDAMARAEQTLREVIEDNGDTPDGAVSAIAACSRTLREAAGAIGVHGVGAMTLAQVVVHLGDKGLVDDAIRARLAVVIDSAERILFGNEHADTAFVAQFAHTCLDAVMHMAAIRAASATSRTEARAA